MQTTMTLPTAACQFAGGAASLSSPAAQFGAAGPETDLRAAQALVRSMVAAWPKDATHRAVVTTTAGKSFAPAAPGSRGITEADIRRTATLMNCTVIEAFERLWAARAPI